MLAAIALGFGTVTVHAQSVPVDETIAEAREALTSGDFSTAGAAVDRGLGREVLARDELVVLLSFRALLAYADDRLGLLEESLRALATLSAPLPTDFPAPLAARYLEVLASTHPIELSLELATAVDRGRRAVRLVPRVEGDEGRLVRSVRISGAIDDGPLALRSIDVALDAGDPHRDVAVRYALEALGPGGVVVAGAGTTTVPQTERLRGLPIDETFLHVALVTIASVLLAGAVTVGAAYFATDGFTTGQSTNVRTSCAIEICAP